MITPQTLFEFSIIALLLALAPGPDIFLVFTMSVAKGFRAAISLVIGLCSGVIVHTIVATLGVSVIFKTSEVAFTILKIAGAMYLFYLAYQAFIHRNDVIEIDKNNKYINIGNRKLLIRGFFMNVLNPKVALFFLALFPQFVNEANGKVALQMIQLGAIFMACAFFVFSLVATTVTVAKYLLSYLAKKIFENPTQKEKLSKIVRTVTSLANILTSIIFIAIGLKLAFLQWQ